METSMTSNSTYME